MKFLKKILLVDHEPKITALVRRALESTGNYLVKVEQDSRLALHAAPWFVPDLVLLDAAKGEDVNRQLKSDPSLKVVTGGFISGYSFLATAVTLDDLIRCVEEMLNPAPAPAAKKARAKTSR